VRLHDLLDIGARTHPDWEFAVQGTRRLTYGEAATITQRLARAFLHRGLGRGDRVAVLAKNSIEMLLLYFGAARAGVVPVPLNYRLAPPEWRSIIDDAGARVLFAGRDYVDEVSGIRATLATVESLVALDGGGPAGWEDFRAWLPADVAAVPRRDVTEDDDVYQMYTSGTTGRPKGAVLIHRAVTANVAQIARACGGPAGERSLVVAPHFHAAAVPSAFSPISWGGSLVLVE
jgi:acyl-CoA synthetase (AMP-forming)/AMP-acid ligase II